MTHHTKDSVCPHCEELLADAHPELAYWYRFSVKARHPEAHVAVSFRSQADQDKAVAEKRSKLFFPHSAHNHMELGKPCALALDIFQITDACPNGIWDPKFMALINSECEEREDPIAWGGRWKTLGDYDHFQWDTNKV